MHMCIVVGEGAKELFGYESDRRRNLLIYCLRKSFAF